MQTFLEILEIQEKPGNSTWKTALSFIIFNSIFLISIIITAESAKTLAHFKSYSTSTEVSE